MQGINIYYSCVTIVFSIYTLKYEDYILSFMTVVMTISLLVVNLYLNAQKYLGHAREYRKNYTQLHKLEIQLGHLLENDMKEMNEIEDKYCELLDLGDNHISYDYYCTVFGSRGEYKEEHWKDIKWKYGVRI